MEYNTESAQPKTRIADSFFQKLLGINLINNDEILIIKGCHDIHTMFMRKNLDVAFVNSQGNILASFKRVKPWSRLKYKSACFVLERYASNNQWPKVGQNIKQFIGKEDYESLSDM